MKDEHASPAASEVSADSLDKLALLFARHMRARAMLRSVTKAEKEALAEIVWTLKAVPADLRQETVAISVERATAGLILESS